jgi:hypothetical protein
MARPLKQFSGDREEFLLCIQRGRGAAQQRRPLSVADLLFPRVRVLDGPDFLLHKCQARPELGHGHGSHALSSKGDCRYHRPRSPCFPQVWDGGVTVRYWVTCRLRLARMGLPHESAGGAGGGEGLANRPARCSPYDMTGLEHVERCWRRGALAVSTDLSPGIRIESDDNTDRMVNMLPDWISTAHVEETYGLSLSTTGPCDGGCGF